MSMNSIGMDLVRLVLERAKTSREAVEICSSLLEEFGQGGGCAEDDSSWCYENGFLFADMEEAWVFETAGNTNPHSVVMNMRYYNKIKSC